MAQRSAKQKANDKAGRCPFGKKPYATKREAEAAGGKAKRCGRCRQWHAS